MMARYLILCLALMICSALGFISPAQELVVASRYDDDGCGKSLPPGQALGSVTNLTIISGGIDRSYLLFIPPKCNTTSENLAPLIISYHGGTKSSLDQLQLDQFTNPEFNEKAVVAYPQGINVRHISKPRAFHSANIIPGLLGWRSRRNCRRHRLHE